MAAVAALAVRATPNMRRKAEPSFKSNHQSGVAKTTPLFCTHLRARLTAPMAKAMRHCANKTR